MKTIKVSKIGYLRLFNRLKGNLRVVLDEIGIYPGMTEEERKEAIYKAFNPEMPLFIDYHTTKGLFRISPK